MRIAWHIRTPIHARTATIYLIEYCLSHHFPLQSAPRLDVCEHIRIYGAKHIDTLIGHSVYTMFADSSSSVALDA